LDKPAEDEEIAKFEAGVDIGDDVLTLPAHLKILPDNQALLTIHEGRFHQVKRMFHAVGKEVVYLKRLSMGPISLPEDLEKGAFLELQAHEVNLLKMR
jgi:16S rRNA pseudouridine516 synthase